MMTYLVGYFAVGALLFVAVLVANRLTQRNDAEFGSLTRGGANRGRKTYRLDFVDDVLTPVLGTAFVIVAWPVVVYWKVREWVPSGRADGNSNERTFSVRHEHLVQAVTLDTIERMERVHDPLGAVPDQPFGHLHEAWQQFKADLQPRDALWTFAADWTNDWGWQEHLTGYVIVTVEGPGRYFLTSRRKTFAGRGGASTRDVKRPRRSAID